jgi:aryl-phospho-beta-D-glucosidase BglC (GH1 family)
MTLYYKDELVWGKEGPIPPPKPVPPPAEDDWLHVDGNQIKDAKGNAVHLTGINWFGFETDGANGFYGLNKCNLEDSLKLMADRGFNLLRIPMSAEIIKEWMNGKYVDTSFVNTEENPNLDGMNSLQILDYTVEHCRMTGMKIMFDMHGYKKDSYQEPLWYDATFTMKDFIASWEWLTKRYKNDDTVIAMDLKNEPHGKYNGPKVAKWDGSSDPNNWRKAAEDIGNAVLAINPNLLIVVEGIEAYPKEGYDYTNNGEFTTYFNWWGGNLRGVAEYPVELSVPNKLIYSPHEYGPDIYMQPWFKKTFDIDTLYNDTWYPNWYYIVDKGIAPVLIGEWGGKLANATNKLWFKCIAEFIAKKQLNHTFWSFNPNSADTGGLMLEDWKTVDEEKYNIIKQALWMKGLDHVVPLGGFKQGEPVRITGYISAGNTDSKSGFKVELENTSVSALTDENGFFELSSDGKTATASLRILRDGYLSRTLENINLGSISGSVEVSSEETPLVLWVGDFNGDKAINMPDIMSIATAFNSSKGDSRYLDKLDVNSDTAVNLEDIMVVVEHFNRSSDSYDGL